MKSVAQVRSLVRSRVGSDLLVTAGTRWAQMGIALVGNVLAARALGPEDFGRFGLVFAVVNIGTTLADAGLTYTAIKYIAQDHTAHPDRAYRVAWLYWWLRLTTGAAGLVGGIALAAPLAALIGHTELTPALQGAFLTLGSLAISSYPGMVLVGLGQFGRLGGAGVLNALITVGGIAGLFAAGRLDLPSLIAWNVLLPLVSTVPAWLLLPGGWRPWRLLQAGTAAGPPLREMLGFSRWMGLSLLGSIIIAQGDLLVLGRLATPAVVGVYSVALTLAMRLDTLNQSLFTVLMPRASRLTGLGALRRYTRQVGIGSLALAGALGVIALAAQPLIVLLYGARYAPAAGLFLALLVVVLFDLATSSLFLVTFPLNRPRLLAGADWLRVGVLFAAGGLLIPLYGGFGAVAARLLARVTGTAVILAALRRALGRET